MARIQQSSSGVVRKNKDGGRSKRTGDLPTRRELRDAFANYFQEKGMETGSFNGGFRNRKQA